MIFHKILAGLFMTVLCYPHTAWADIAGRYETKDENAIVKMEMTIEADNEGRVRFQMGGTSAYYLLSDGEMFLVEKKEPLSEVIRLADFFAVQQEILERMGWKDTFLTEEGAPPVVEFAPMDEEIVGGRKGTGYGTVSQDNDKPKYASVVISDDPQLAPIGQALAVAQSSSIKGMGSIGSMLSMMNSNMLDLLAKGAPLRLLHIELTDISSAEIPKSRFTLPAIPLTIDQVRKRMAAALEPPPTLPPRDK